MVWIIILWSLYTSRFPFKRYADTIKEDIKKNDAVTVEPHDSRSWTARDWYLPHHPVINLNKPVKVRRVLNGAAKFHGTSLNQSPLVGPGLLQNLIIIQLCFRQHKYAVSADIEVCSSRKESATKINLRFVFCGGTTPRCGSPSVHLPYVLRLGLAYVGYPEVASVVAEKHYMDDYLHSLRNINQAVKDCRSVT